MNIFAAMKPDAVCKSVYDIPLDSLKEAGKTCLLLDFDNTLGPDHATAPDKYAYDFIDKIRNEGFSCCLVSNAKSGRSSKIAEMLNIPFVTYAHTVFAGGVHRLKEKDNALFLFGIKPCLQLVDKTVVLRHLRFRVLAVDAEAGFICGAFGYFKGMGTVITVFFE